MKRHGLKSDKDLAFIRAYEVAIVQLIEQMLAQETRK